MNSLSLGPGPLSNEYCACAEVAFCIMMNVQGHLRTVQGRASAYRVSFFQFLSPNEIQTLIVVKTLIQAYFNPDFPVQAIKSLSFYDLSP